jgi:hypothetical protein
VTGRPRRCGWLDIAALRRSFALNGVTGTCITKLDVLTGSIPCACTGYEPAAAASTVHRRRSAPGSASPRATRSPAGARAWARRARSPTSRERAPVRRPPGDARRGLARARLDRRAARSDDPTPGL